MGESAGNGDVLPPDGLGHDRANVFEPQGSNPTDHVVGERGEHGPGGVGIEVPRWAMCHTCSVLQVPDGQFDHGVVTVVGVEGTTLPSRSVMKAW